MNEIFEKIYNNNNTSLNEDTALFEKVYMEVKMLNEMNPKLKALLAAGLIGTAGLGAVSCSMPTDDPYDAQYTIEQPTPENPEETKETEDSEDSEEITDFEEIENSGEIEDSEETKETEDSEDSEDFEDPENPEDSENPVTFETLGVEEYAESLARAKKDPTIYEQIASLGSQFYEYIYKDEKLDFIPLKVNKNNQYEDNQTYIRYINLSTLEIFYVPVDMEFEFNQAIAVYKATH